MARMFVHSERATGLQDGALVDLRLPNPSPHRRLGQIEITRDLAGRLAALPEQRDHLRLVLRREIPSFLLLRGHEHLPASSSRAILGVLKTGSRPIFDGHPKWATVIATSSNSPVPAAASVVPTDVDDIASVLMLPRREAAVLSEGITLYGNDRLRQFLRIVVLTGREIFSDHGPPFCWRDLGEPFARVSTLCKPATDLLSFAQATQYAYLGLEPDESRIRALRRPVHITAPSGRVGLRSSTRREIGEA